MSIFSDDEERPRSVSMGHYKDERFVLTHVNWHASPTYSPQPETGVTVDGGPFRLIQHGWHDFKAAEAVILAGLRKGWDTERICDLIQWLRQRRRPKARLA